MRGCPRRVCRIKKEEGLGPNTREQPGGGQSPAWKIHVPPSLCFLPGTCVSQVACDGWAVLSGAGGSPCLTVFTPLVLLRWGSLRQAKVRWSQGVRWGVTVPGEQGHGNVHLSPCVGRVAMYIEALHKLQSTMWALVIYFFIALNLGKPPLIFDLWMNQTKFIHRRFSHLFSGSFSLIVKGLF